MNTQKFNLFIIDDNEFMVTGLRNYLEKKFGEELNISTFLNGESALKQIDRKTHIVILDYFLGGKNGNDILKSIKHINPDTEVIMLSSNEDIGIAIESFRAGASGYLIKGGNSWKKLSILIYNIIAYPIRILVREFRVSKFLAIFLLTFAIMGIGVYITLRLFNW